MAANDIITYPESPYLCCQYTFGCLAAPPCSWWLASRTCPCTSCEPCPQSWIRSWGTCHPQTPWCSHHPTCKSLSPTTPPSITTTLSKSWWPWHQIFQKLLLSWICVIFLHHVVGLSFRPNSLTNGTWTILAYPLSTVRKILMFFFRKIS